MKEITFRINPKGKPRMVRSDKWRQRPVVTKYWAFKDELVRQGKGFSLPDSFRVTFGIQVPNSYGQKGKLLIGTPHRKRPDLDNLLKSLQDCLNSEDSSIWNIEARKVWSREGFIHIEYEE